MPGRALIYSAAMFALGAPLLAQSAPHLEKRGSATQLIVDGKPFLMLSGELSNSTSSSLEYMKPIWPKLAEAGLNTVVTPLSWELIEPVEGKYDFTLVDGLLAQARQSHERVVFLWLASWKNGMSSYAPVWVKADTKRFPRVELNGAKVEVLSPQSKATLEADAKAFAALMRHIKQVDGTEHTVLAMQVENEVGILGGSRDHSAAANAAFRAAVPEELPRYLKAHRANLDPEMLTLWERNGEKMSGTWAEVFGDSDRADEIFMAWNYARFIHHVAAAGKAEYDLPMYVNTWLGGEGAKPGTYPSGGPEPRVLDVWKAAAPATGYKIDIYSPDLYASDFEGWTKRYHRDGNPLFIPETNGGVNGAKNVFYAVGAQDAICFAPFAIDRWLMGGPEVQAMQPRPTGEGIHFPPPELAASYKALAQIWPVVAEAQSKGDSVGFLLDKEHPSMDLPINGYIAHVSLDGVFGYHADTGYGLIVATGPGEFLGAGSGFRVAFSLPDSKTQVGIGAVDEGTFEDGKWVAGRRLNGDENDQGRYWRVDASKVNIEKASVYRVE